VPAGLRDRSRRALAISHSGGPRAGSRHGGEVGSPRLGEGLAHGAAIRTAMMRVSARRPAANDRYAL
jgi:hypothetical protein